MIFGNAAFLPEQIVFSNKIEALCLLTGFIKTDRIYLMHGKIPYPDKPEIRNSKSEIRIYSEKGENHDTQPAPSV